MPSPLDPILVLVVEDERLIRMVVADALAEAGIVVVEAQNANEALRVLGDKAIDVHVLFTDIHMPGHIDGLALAHHVREHWPWIGLLIASGLASPTASEMPHGCRFMPKPYTIDHAINHVRELALAR
jgi:CheY-like chemotaxis protein